MDSGPPPDTSARGSKKRGDPHTAAHTTPSPHLAGTTLT
ncbi:hypothetical protein E2C01_098399 [Portunus trituberculatus]|uniref:Uncharacterized protein n=1 Tax=Portunus trituberculatus TaxID=210409 RepID=A0A5B7KE35_PORTR|nr:hypothetical protein [Portunus trituberculatus]